MADVEWTVSAPNQVLTAASVTNTEQSVQITVPNGKSRARKIELKCTQDWFYRSAEGGAGYLVKADEPFIHAVQGDASTFYVIRSTADGTLYAFVAE